MPPGPPGRAPDAADPARAALDRLRRWGGDDLVREMVAIFLDETPIRLAAARDAAARRDGAEVARAVHAMKSAAGQLGAVAMQRLCEEAEARAEAGDLARAEDLLARIDQEFEAFRDWLRSRTRGGGAVRTLAVVEDNADNRLLLQAILGDRYALREYETGPEALAGLEAEPPDAVLLDISLPGMDGVEVLRRIRASARLRHLPVIALTAHAMSGDRERYLAAGFDDYVTKPIVDEALLLGAVARCVAGAA